MTVSEMPWLPFYVGRWLTDPVVTTASLAAQGAYVRLICHEWLHGSLPVELNQLARIVAVGIDEFNVIWSEIQAAFTVGEDGRLYLEWVEAERKTRTDSREKLQAAALKRWENRRGGEPKPPKHTKPKAPKKETPKKEPTPPDPDTPYAIVERVLKDVSRQLGGSEVVSGDVVRQLKPESPLRQLLSIYGGDESKVASMYVYAAGVWTKGVSWSGVFTQRDKLTADMAGGSKLGTATRGDSLVEKRNRLREGNEPS